MRGYIIKTKVFKLQVKYLKRKASGLYYFRRGIPEELRHYFSGKREIVESLHTYSQIEAVKSVRLRARQVEDEFNRLRNGSSQNDEAERVIREAGLEPKPITQQRDDESMYSYDELMREIGDSIAITEGHHVYYNDENLDPVLRRVKQILQDEVPLTLSDAMNRQFKLHADNPSKLKEVERYFGFFIRELKEDEIARISRDSIENLIVEMSNAGLQSATIKKYVVTVSKGVKDLIRFKGSHLLNPFESLHIPNKGKDQIPRHTFTPDELRMVCKLVRNKPDLLTSKLIGLLINTGCRLHEVAGLSIKNINVADERPHILIEDQPNRKIKNKHSNRYVPLIGISLDSAVALLDSAKEGQVYAFPNWNKRGVLTRNTPSAAVNKALRHVTKRGTSHSFRHTLNTRLIDAGVSRGAIDELLGWSSEAMGRHYGKPDMLRLNLDSLNKMQKFEAKSDQGYKAQ